MENKTDIAALILRVSLGIVLIAHGLLKVLVFTLPGTVQFFDSVGFPGWTAYPVTLLEIAGGWEYPAFLTVALLVQALLGPGAFALRLPERPATAATA